MPPRLPSPSRPGISPRGRFGIVLAGLMFAAPAAWAQEGDTVVASRSISVGSADRSSLAGVRDLLARRRWSDAEHRLLSLQATHPNDADVGALLGIVLRRTGKIRQATTVLEQTVQIQPRHRSARETLGTLYLLNREPAKAIDQLVMLKQICAGTCAEARNLSEAIASYSP